VSHAVRLLAFAGARDAIGVGELSFPLEIPVSVGVFLERVCAAYPALAPYRGCIRLAVNGTYANEDEVVSGGDEVALIPPVAGG
jgi:molybdopterin synthase catalytic subunit/molybdopterin synthase sulfur carrier subunit